MKKLLMVISLLFVTTSCSTTKLAVEWADSFIAWRLDDDFDLSRDQKKQIRPELKKAVQNLKKEMFPQYSSFLLEAKSDLSAVQDKARAEEVFATIEQRAEVQLELSLKAIRPQLVAMSQKLTLSNWKEFKDEFEDKNEDLLEDGPKKRLKKRIEHWVGSLSKEQAKKIEEFEKARAFPVAIRVQNRAAALKKFEEKSGVTNTTLVHEKFSAAVSEFANDYKSFQSQEYLTAMAEYRKDLRGLFADIYLSLNDKQKAKFFANLEKRATELKELSL